MGLGGLGEDVEATCTEGFWANGSAASSFEFFNRDAVVVQSNDDLTTAPSAAALKLAGDIGIPRGWPANADWVFKDQWHDGGTGVGLALGKDPVIFTGHEGLSILRGLADVVVWLIGASGATEDPFVLKDVRDQKEAESIVRRLRFDGVGVGIRTGVVGCISFHGHDDLAGI